MSTLPDRQPISPSASTDAGRFKFRRLLPLAAIAAIAATIIALGWQRELSLENLIRHRATIDAFTAAHGLAAIAAFIALYIAVVALSIPGAVFLTIAGGILFGTIITGLAVIVGATAGATIIFLITKSALGEFLVRRAGAVVGKIADGFRADAFSYLLFLRLVPIFPFWLVNLVPAICGVRLPTFVTATALGIIPGTFAFAFFGAGLDSAIAAQEAAYKACLAAGNADCHLAFDLKAAATPQLITALAALGIVALVPIVIKRVRTARASNASQPR
jgi:uncharacterized membrane protein YdjX (TVP38/TMEM64 family)